MENQNISKAGRQLASVGGGDCTIYDTLSL